MITSKCFIGLQNMKTLTRDISVTLIIKLALLMALWFVCFRGVHTPMKKDRQWLFSKPTSTDAGSVTRL